MLPRYTLRQLGYFAAVIEAGSITAAADRLRMSPAAVGAAIDELERIAGSPLVVRRRARGVTPTPTGSYAYERAGELLRAARELELSLTSTGDSLVGPLAVGSYTTLAPTALPPLLAWLRDAHPRIDLRVVTGSQDELPEQLLGGELDLAIVYDRDLPEGLCAAPLYETPPYVLLPASHPLVPQEIVTLEELAPLPMVLLDLPPSRQHTASLFDARGLHPTIAHRTSDFELTRSLVGRGFGYAILVQRPVIDRTYEGHEVVVRPLPSDLAPVQVSMTWAEDTTLTERARALLDHATDRRVRASAPVE